MSRQPQPDWFLQEWMTHLGKVQFSLVTELEWHRATANKVWHGLQPYKRDQLNQIAAWLNVRPYELLMHPDEAMAIRRLRDGGPREVAPLSQAPEEARAVSTKRQKAG